MEPFKVHRHIIRSTIGLIMSLALLLTSCGGGGGSSTAPPPPPPLIQALLFSLPQGSTYPANFANAMVGVTESSTGANITTASVTMNGVALTYNSATGHQQYEGNVSVNPNSPVNLIVKVGSLIYTAAGTQFTTYPTISAPASGDAWDANSINTVTWSAGAPTTNAAYLLGVLDATDPNGGTPYFNVQPIGTTTFPIPANSLTVGNREVFVGITTPVAIPNADPNSAFVFGGFNYVPVSVYTWTSRYFGGSILKSVAWSGTKFVAVGGSTILTSPDGMTWTTQTLGTVNTLSSVIWAGTQFVAVGDAPGSVGAVLTSPDGVTWTAQTLGVIPVLYGVAKSGTNLVAVGFGGTIITSSNGISWTAQTSGTTKDLYGVTSSGTMFEAFGVGGTILTSPDGATWTTQNSGTTNALSGAVWSGTQFVTVGEMGLVLTSPNGVTWTASTAGSNPLYSIAWTGTQFVAVGNGGVIYTSPDGVTWTAQTSGVVYNLYGVAWSGTQIVAVGDSTILTSP